MKKSDFLGWKEVFAFSFEQGVKEKAFVVFLVIMFLVMLLATPVTTFFKQDDGEVKSSSIRTLQVYDLTGLPIAYAEAKLQDGYDKVQVVLAGTTLDAYETYVEKLAKEEAEPALAVKVEYSPEQGFVLTYVKPAEGVEEEDAGGLADQFTAYFELAKLTAIDVTMEQYAFLNRPVNTESVFLNASGEVVPPSQEESISLDQYYILLAGIVIITLFVSFSGGNIATSIVTEKSTRVIEYLMINVRPMALLTGKILGSLALTVVQFGVIGIGYVGSKYLTSALFGEQTQTESSFLEFLVNRFVQCHNGSRYDSRRNPYLCYISRPGRCFCQQAGGDSGVYEAVSNGDAGRYLRRYFPVYYAAHRNECRIVGFNLQSDPYLCTVYCAR